jgi:hypothetical protein
MYVCMYVICILDGNLSSKVDEQVNNSPFV